MVSLLLSLLRVADHHAQRTEMLLLIVSTTATACRLAHNTYRRHMTSHPFEWCKPCIKDSRGTVCHGVML